YPGLVEYMGSAPLVALIVEGQGAIAGFRTLAGATNPTEAAPGTIRGDLSREWDLPVIQNLVHGSDSEDSAAREIAIWFPEQACAEYSRPPGPRTSGPRAANVPGGLQNSPGEAVHTVLMDLTVVTVLFLLTAVLVAIAILLAVALPNLRRREDHDDGTGSGEDRRHSSRTPREP